MWRAPSEKDPLQRLLDKVEGRGKKTMQPDDQGIPDLLADNGHLSNISTVRDAVRSMLRAARQQDSQSSDLQETCVADTQRFLLFLCCRIVGGQQRDLTEK